MKRPSRNYLIVEFLTLFLSFPVLLGINSIPLSFRLFFIPLVAAYVIYLLYTYRGQLFQKRKQIQPLQFWKKVGLRGFVLAVFTIGYILYVDSNLLFKSILTQPMLWVRMILIYTFLSVIPQEFIYRVFYFKRYRILFKNQNAFFLVNAILFSLAHLMFNSLLVLFFTFVGGYLFAYTYHKTKSLFWVCIEHLIYGGWLFTVGMGKMLGFPI